MKIETVVDEKTLIASDSLLVKSDGEVELNLFANGKNSSPLKLVFRFVAVDKPGKNPVTIEAKQDYFLIIRIQVDNGLMGAMKESVEIAGDDERGSTLHLNFRTSTRNDQVLLVYNIYEKKAPPKNLKKVKKNGTKSK